MESERRRARIVELVRSREFVRVADLGEIFGVSSVTVRGDLDVLAARGDLRRIRGGAISQEAPRAADPADEPDAIGRLAAGLLRSGECACLDAGATGLARALAARTDLREAVVVTNGLEVARLLEPAIPRLTVIVSGGTLAPGQGLVDPLGDLVMGRLRADAAFMTCAALDAAGGATDPDLRAAAVKRRMLEAARRRVVLVPGAGIGAVRTAAVCAVDDVDVLVTGPGAAPAALEELGERGVEVMVA